MATKTKAIQKHQKNPTGTHIESNITGFELKNQHRLANCF